jgi:hypothetical protein
MPRTTTFHLLAALTFVLLMTSRHAAAQSEQFLPGKYGTGHLSAAVTNQQVTFSWPAQAGNWLLLQQLPADQEKWKPVASAQYQTNFGTVSVTLPVPSQTTFYCVKRSIILRRTALPVIPPLPPMPTNRPPGSPRPGNQP